LVIVLGVPGYLVWHMLAEHVNDLGAATTREDVTEFTGIAPPAEATDLCVASIDHGQARVMFVRFTAPVDVCEKYALAMIPGATLQPLTWNQKYSDSGVVRIGSLTLNDLRWFDLPYLRSYWKIVMGKPFFDHQSAQEFPKSPDMVGADTNNELKGYLVSGVRVDRARGVFYFIQAN